MFCPKCGLKNKEDAKFCENCGNNLNAASKITKKDTGSPCPKCGLKNKKDAKFCEKCGNRLNTASKISKITDSPVKFLIVICLVLVAGIGIAAGYIFQGHGVNSNSPGNLLIMIRTY